MLLKTLHKVGRNSCVHRESKMTIEGYGCTHKNVVRDFGKSCDAAKIKEEMLCTHRTFGLAVNLMLWAFKCVQG